MSETPEYDQLVAEHGDPVPIAADIAATAEAEPPRLLDEQEQP